MSNFFPSEGHDIVDSTELRQLADANAEFSDSNLAGQLSLFRSEVSELLTKSQAPVGSLVMALYFTNPTEQPVPSQDGALLETHMAMMPHEILVCLLGQKSMDTPVIRIITNEPVFTEDQPGSYIVEDITIDDEHEAMYGIGALYLNELGPDDKLQYPLIRLKKV